MTKKKITKSVTASDAAPAIGQSADTTPTAKAIDEMAADPFREAAVAAHNANMTQIAAASFHEPNPNRVDPARLTPITPGDSLAALAASLMSTGRR